MIVFLSTADTDLLTLSHALDTLPDGLQVRAYSPSDLSEPAALEHFFTQVVPEAHLFALRLLGGKRAFAGFDRLAAEAKRQGAVLLAWPGDQEPDPELDASTTASQAIAMTALTYLMQGGSRNMAALFRFLSDRLLQTTYGYDDPVALAPHGIYQPGRESALTLAEALQSPHYDKDAPTIGLLFYRAHFLSRNLDFVDALVSALQAHGCNALPIFCQTLKQEGMKPHDLIDAYLRRQGLPVVDALISTLSFSAFRTAAHGPEAGLQSAHDLLESLDVPVLQAIVSLSSRGRWEESSQGLGPLDAAMNVAMPEFDGRIISVPMSFKDDASIDPRLGIALRRYVAIPDRVDLIARLAKNHAKLRRKANAQKRIAILLTNYPAKNSRIGNAVGLDVPNSVIAVLRAMQAKGYTIGDIPESGDDLISAIIARCSNDSESLTESQLQLAAGHLSFADYQSRFAALSQKPQQELQDAWGDPPGNVLTVDADIVIPGIALGHVFIGLQPPRGFGENPIAVYHSPDLVPTHQYIGYYTWLRDNFKADAVVHMGKHGTLEWLPGKGMGLSQDCYPDIVLSDLPNFYPYIINNPGEGTQAKRRSHAVIVDHMIPPMTTADTYDDLARLEQLLDEYYQVQTLDPTKLPVVQAEIWKTIQKASLDQDLRRKTIPAADGFDDFLVEVDGYLCELKAAQIRDGLHTLGGLPSSAQQLCDLTLALTRLANGQIPALPDALRQALALPEFEAPLGTAFEAAIPPALLPYLASNRPTIGDLQLAIESLGKALLLPRVPKRFANESIDESAPAALQGTALQKTLHFIETSLWPRLMATEQEIDWLLHGLSGGRIAPGPSGAPTRGMADILPTGRNFYSVDPRAVPSEAAWRVGQALAEALLQRYHKEEGAMPESVGIVVWGTAAMRTQGDDIAEVLALLGVRPLWQKESRRVVGLEVIPLSELKRPRIDVTVRMSGFFRDAFPSVIAFLDRAIALVADLDEEPEDNFVRKHVLSDTAQRVAAGVPEKSARERALYRLFGSKPGTYGSGILPLVESRDWRDDQDLARVYITWSGYAYTGSRYGVPAAAEFQERLRGIQVATKNQDNREHDIFDSDDYFQDHGGLVATIRALSGHNPKQYFGDSHRPDQVVVRDLADEAKRVFRTRVVNPKWLQSIRRHGYKGAMELAATVDFLFGYDATAGVVEDFMYEKVTEAYVFDETMQDFFQTSNPWALRDVAERLLEAAERGLWADPKAGHIEGLKQAMLDAEASLEGRQEGPR